MNRTESQLNAETKAENENFNYRNTLKGKIVTDSIHRILIIDRCDECKYANKEKLICSHSIHLMGKDASEPIHPYFHIPHWCPLPLTKADKG